MSVNKQNLAQVWLLLKQNISKSQFAGYAVANLLGLAIILIAALFYADCTTPVDGEEKDAVSSDYVVLSKRVTGIGLTPETFTDEEIARLQQQTWVETVGRFTSSNFSVHGSVELGGRGLATYLFFESVPDEFFDIKPVGWNFDIDERFVPIMISKDYLALYNYGFAVPQGLPQLSEEVIGLVPIRLRLSGENSQTEYFDARIVGFSSRLNTIAVPQQFMDWANNHFAPDVNIMSSRLIVKVNSFDSPEMAKYLVDNDIEQAGDDEASLQRSYFISITMGVVAVVGVIICLLATAILILSIYLLLQKTRDKLRNLMLLGYSPKEIGQCYEFVVCGVNCVVGLGAVILALFGRCCWLGALEQIGYGGGSVLPMIIIAVLFVILISINSIFIIRRQLTKIWYS